MVIFLTVLLGVSIVGIVGLLTLRHYEIASDRLVMTRIRPTVSNWLGTLLHMIERQAPSIVRYWGTIAYRRGYTVVHRTVAWLVLFVEALLERTLHLLRHSTRERGEQPSAFLREVAEHKKELQKGPAEDRAIYED